VGVGGVALQPSQTGDREIMAIETRPLPRQRFSSIMFDEEADFWAPRTCLLAPLPDHQVAANLLSTAVDAITANDLEAAFTKVRRADNPVLFAFARRLMGPNDIQIHRRRPVPAATPRTGKASARMPTAWETFALYTRDGWRCRFCECRVMSSHARSAIRAIMPDAVPWGKAEGYHGAFFAMTASIDHVVPHSAGGGNEPENLVTACWSCQFGRGSYTIGEMGLLDPRERPPVVDGWDGLSRVLTKVASSALRKVQAVQEPMLSPQAGAPSPVGSDKRTVSVDSSSNGANWLASIDPVNAAASRAMVGFLEDCKDLGVSWSLNKVLLARMGTGSAAVAFLAIEPDGRVQVPWSLGGRKDEFRGFAEKLAEGVPGSIVYETPKLWNVANSDRSRLTLPQLLDGLSALRVALETLHSALEASH
jgi:hypothetical protein